MKIDIICNKLDQWIEEQRLNELSLNTLKQYRNSVNKFILFLNENNIEFVTKQKMLDYRVYLDEISESTNSKNAWIIGLNKYLKYLGLSSLCLKQIRQQKRYFNYDNMSLSDYKRLLRKAKEYGMIQDYYIIKTLAMTGIRISELRYFTVENLKKCNSDVLHIYNKGKSRDIPLRRDLASSLRKYCRDNKIVTGYIFKSSISEEKMITQSTIWKHLQDLAGYARIKKKVVHAHSFRHLFADVFLATYPENILDLADIMGHSSLETTRIYSRRTLKQKKEILSKMRF